MNESLIKRPLRCLLEAALQAAEKVNSKRHLVAQALLPVLVLLPLTSMHSQEWLCYSTFSAACLAAEAEFDSGSRIASIGGPRKR
jgi:hypothetical protein